MQKKTFIVQFQKKQLSTATPWKVIEIRNSQGKRGLKSQNLEGKYEAKLEFPGRRGGGVAKH